MFYELAERLRHDKVIEVFVMVVGLTRVGMITGEKASLDSLTIGAWSKECRYANWPSHDDRRCRHHRARDRGASWTWDCHRETLVHGYEVRVAIDSLLGLPMMLTVTKAGYGDGRSRDCCS